MDAPLREQIRHLLLDRRDTRVLLGVTAVVIAALVAGAVMAYAARAPQQPDLPTAQVAARSTATPSPAISTPAPTPFAPAFGEPAPSPSATAATPAPTPTQADPVVEPTPTSPPEIDPTPAPDPAVELRIGDHGYGLPGIAGFRITDGDSVVEVLHLTTRDLDQTRCRVTQTFEPDDTDVSGWSVSLPAESEQDVALADGTHTFEARCPSVVGTVSSSVAAIAMDGRPEACEGFAFARDEITASSYEDLTAGIVGTWRGCVSTPWTPMYEVTFTFNADGTYSAMTDEVLDGSRMIALYYGSDEDSPLKTYAITDLQASRLGVGQIDIYFFQKSVVRGSLRNVRLMGDRLEFEVFNRDYGPVTFQVARIDG
jgi:hypothetical protein